MKEKNPLTSVMRAALCVLVGTVIVTDASAQACKQTPRSPQNIVLEIDGGQPQFRSKACTEAGAQPGDMCNEIGAKPRIVFKLQGASSNGWRLVRMELTTSGGGWSNPVLPNGAYEDFGFSTDPSNPDRVKGWAPGSLNSSGNQLTVRNDNCNAFDVDYRVVLSDPSGNLHYAHPRVLNKGGG